MSEWTLTTDEMPPAGKFILVLCQDAPIYDIVRWNGKNWEKYWGDERTVFVKNFFSHWQYLPPIPKPFHVAVDSPGQLRFHGLSTPPGVQVTRGRIDLVDWLNEMWERYGPTNP